jgi:hypothetical protein
MCYSVWTFLSELMSCRAQKLETIAYPDPNNVLCKSHCLIPLLSNQVYDMFGNALKTCFLLLCDCQLIVLEGFMYSLF